MHSSYGHHEAVSAAWKVDDVARAVLAFTSREAARAIDLEPEQQVARVLDAARESLRRDPLARPVAPTTATAQRCVSRSAGVPGNNEAVCPSSPMPRSVTSNSGRPEASLSAP